VTVLPELPLTPMFQGRQARATRGRVGAMTVREWVASACFLAFIVLKLTELLVPLESWPLSNIAMFSERRPAHVLPQRIHIYGRRGGQWVELTEP
jgi:hypothetical protein